MALAPIPKSCPAELRQVVAVEAVAPGLIDSNNAREWRPASEGARARTGGRPAIGAVHLYKVSQTETMIEAKRECENCARAATECRECITRREVQAPYINVAQPRWVGPK